MLSATNATLPLCCAVVARGLFGWGGDAATETATAEATTNAPPSTTSADEQPAVLPPAIDMQPLAGPFGAEPPQALIDAQLAHMIESPELDDFEEVRGRASRRSLLLLLQHLMPCSGCPALAFVLAADLNLACESAAAEAPTKLHEDKATCKLSASC